MAKGVVTAYALWAFGGPLGLHHLYLGRDSHALLWLLTLGGFGVGWARELFRIPSYVGEANREAARRTPRHPLARPPPISVARFAGQICVGLYFGTVALIGLNSLSFFYLMVLPLCVGAGVHLVSIAGHETSDLRKTLTACLITSPIFYGSALSPLPISLAASFTAAQHRQFKQPRPTNALPEPLVSRLYRLGLAWLAFSAPLGYCVFHNTTATLYYLSDCVVAVLDALWFFPWFGRALEYLLLLPYRILCTVTGGGGGLAEETWRKVMEILLQEYSKREKEALKVLLVSEEASLEEITQSYRELVKVWHPDRNRNRAQEAQEMFIQIQEAYETLLRHHKAFHRK
ncbi:dnaJ homolog subfamily C member 22 [Conger conger]|uniref:dnaJ homolog subfamily C member 22 n=1 Tax=Conger conger TaxID=82655 RepID=UPI002A59BC53|nr:dnaJ homolog subfamily C member 22 [Conger conger]XP_061113536.1 dnaJ homolog subfamily C member 22 [Conger conger]XP_061113537.1 dnaJ homolog subfamily C member 22 [Conger conger]XP_061113538.1 dnaJ homolog subfamily C member 22 [Conger conger]XP_061113539.1 dnaJ homolog subfamily C member 22 [Conger conger]